MRQFPVLASGWLGVALLASPSFAQFAADRAPAPRPTPVGTPAAAPMNVASESAYQPSSQPAVNPTASPSPMRNPAPASAPQHPWSVRPEHGAWFICAKSYVGEHSRTLAEELANEVRQTHKAAAYLYEWGSDQRRREEERRDLIRDKLREQQAPFLALRDEMKKKAEVEGTEFDDTPVKVRVPQVNYQQQWAVLIGGFKDMETASAALRTVRTWRSPEGKSHLLDRAVITEQKQSQGAYMNPFASAFVVPNPAIRKDTNAEPEVDPILVKLNENEELSLLKCTKPVTLLVKAFSVPSRTITPDTDTSALGKLFGPKPGSMLDATAQQARTLAEALRSSQMTESLKRMGQPAVPFESYVLHARTGSLVCVGQYESADDPELQRIQRVLSLMTFTVSKEGRPAGVERMFDQVYPIAIPKTR